MLTTSIDDIRAHYQPGKGRHWFDADTLRFFRCRLPQQAYLTADGSRAYFVTSEQGPDMPRRWTVRCYTFATRDIDTIGEFCGYSSRSGADHTARRAALAGLK